MKSDENILKKSEGEELDDYECLKALRQAKAKEAKAKTTSLNRVRKELGIE